MVQAFITLARQLGIAVVAEGVETGADSARLRSFECESGQGFHFHEPLAPEAVESLLGEAAARRG